VAATSPGTGKGAGKGLAIAGVAILAGFMFVLASATAMLGGGNVVSDASCGGTTGENGATTPPGATADAIPPEYLALYQSVGKEYGIDWQILAAIGFIESGHGSNMGPSSAGALGPMQFLPSSWDLFGVDGDKDGDKDINDPKDAIPAAAVHLIKAGGGIANSVHDALFGYNHSEAYVASVIAQANKYGWTGDPSAGIPGAAIPGGAPAGGPNGSPGGTDPSSPAAPCGGSSEFPAGPAELQEAVKLFSPREYVPIPPEFTGGAVELIDARILPNVVYVARTYNLTITQGRGGIGTGSPSISHNQGLALDMVPSQGSSQQIWDDSAGRLAADLGWTPGCGARGSRPTCALVPAISFVGYDGYPSHGSPRTCGGGCPQHIHVSWMGGPNVISDGVLRPPHEWAMAFPSPAAGDASSGGGPPQSGGTPPQ